MSEHYCHGEVYCGAIAVIATTTYMTIVELFDEYPAPFSPEMTMKVIDHDANIYIERYILSMEARKLAVERNRFWPRSTITTILLPFLTW